jgi:hypothetical protein
VSKVFISYRRADTMATSRSVYDRLVAKFGRRNVFKDIDSINLGAQFPAEIRKVLDQCAVVLVLIGSRWLEIADESGSRRLYEPDDYVRLEIELALARNIVVLPILIAARICLRE